MAYEPRIGLEIHAELKTKTKMFCVCKNDPDEQHPNVNVCPICLGHPGTLPVPNRNAIALVQRVGAAFGSDLAKSAKFDRKNYFYPDLPKGYQISQYDMPFCAGGQFTLPNGTTVSIRRIHLEEDTGKLIHPNGKDYSIVDFNRAGVPLMEFVTEPDLRSAEDVGLFAEELQRIFRYLGASDANMEKGQLRIELNVSLKAPGSGAQTPGPLGTKVEVKNLNSVRSARMAVAYEIDRQSRLFDAGKAVVHETRGWHDAKQITFSQRTKEEAHDYRYFPEPDIPPFRFSPADLEAIARELPEFPQARRKRLREEYGLTPEESAVFVDDRSFGDYFEEVMSDLREWASSEKGASVDSGRLTRLAVNYLVSDLRGLLVEHATSITETVVKPEDFAELMRLVAQERITSRVAKDVLSEMFSTGRDPSDIIEEKALGQVLDANVIDEVVARVIAENPKPVEDFRNGKEQALQFLVGKVMAATQGKMNPERARETLRRAISL